MIPAMGDSGLRPLTTMAWGLLLVIVDIRIGVDLVPDPLGWALVVAAAWSLARRGHAFRAAVVAAVVALLLSLPDWAGPGGATGWLVSWLTALALTSVVVAACTGIMALAPERRDGAQAIRAWSLGLTVGWALLEIVVRAQPALAPVSLVVGLAELVVVVAFLVLLFRAGGTRPAGPAGHPSELV
ncbi:MAG: hypothetical protein ACXVW4_11570 [Nocardioides sp.]